MYIYVEYKSTLSDSVLVLKFKSSGAPLAIKSDNYAECLRGP